MSHAGVPDLKLIYLEVSTIVHWSTPTLQHVQIMIVEIN